MWGEEAQRPKRTGGPGTNGSTLRGVVVLSGIWKVHPSSFTSLRV